MYPPIAVGRLCKLFGKSRQAFYDIRKRTVEQHWAEAIVVKLVEELRAEMPRIGTRKLHYLLKEQLAEHNIKMGRDKLYEIMCKYGLLLHYRRRKPYTTNSSHHYRKWPNLIGELLLTHPGQLWVSDITYIRLQNGFCYLFLITDAYSRKIIGWCLSDGLGAVSAIRALQMAVKSKRGQSLIHHSDRGVQYCCKEYVRELQRYRIRISMSEKGNPYQNAIAERVIGILKTELGMGRTFSSIAHAIKTLEKSVDTYNRIRPHSSCDYNTPVVAHELNGILRKRWKSPAEIQKPTLKTT